MFNHILLRFQSHSQALVHFLYPDEYILSHHTKVPSTIIAINTVALVSNTSLQASFAYPFFGVTSLT